MNKINTWKTYCVECGRETLGIYLYYKGVHLHCYLASLWRKLTKVAPDAAPRPPFLDRFIGAARVTQTVRKKRLLCR